MATIVWPAITSFYVSDYQFTGGKETAVQLQSGGTYSVFASTTARYRMTLHYNGLRRNKAAPSPYQASSEARCIRDLLLQLKRGDLAQIADPIDGTQRLWRLDGDFAAFRRIPRTPWYEAEIPLRSVD